MTRAYKRTSAPNDTSGRAPLSPVDFHVLLVLAERELYGYAILQAVEKESGGAVSPEIGSLYRVLGRLLGQGLVAETEPPEGAPTTHRGRPRRYYALTATGRRALESDMARLTNALEIARHRIQPQGSG